MGCVNGASAKNGKSAHYAKDFSEAGVSSVKFKALVEESDGDASYEAPLIKAESLPLTGLASTRSVISCVSSAGSIDEGDHLNISVTCQEDVLREAGEEDLCLFGITNETSDGSPVIENEFDEKDFIFSGRSSKAAVLERLATWPAGISCRKARKPDHPNQDNMFICESNGMTAMGVADGHGEHGHWASHYVVQFVVHLLFRDIFPEAELPTDAEMYTLFDTAHQALAVRFLEMNLNLDQSGTTLTICIIDHCSKTVLTASVGDSRCVHHDGFNSTSLTTDHKPQDLPEMTRIIANGGQVVAGRVILERRDSLNSTLTGNGEGHMCSFAMSRSIGDMMFQRIGVSHRPMVKRTRLVDNEDTPLGGQFILCCSDGVWDFISNEEATDLMKQYLPGRLTEGVEALVNEAKDRWLAQCSRTDDISCVALLLGCATA